ncbi:hypothetical protein Hdeb2414_s0020g00566431 [Helianthus debilis subsp. tardiflorus]
MPSLASMDNNSLLSNVTGLSILVITLIVNVSIQIKTHVISSEYPFMTTTCIYMGMLLFLLIISIASAITIPTSKKLIQFKYEATLNDQHPQENLISTVEKLRQLLKGYWVMAQTGSPQFVMATTPLSSASVIICAVSLALHISLLRHAWESQQINKSVYKKSTSAILYMLTLGVVVGTVAPIWRCFTVLRCKWFGNYNRNHFSVEKFWTQRLCDWKESDISFFSDGENNIKNNILGFCIILQKVIVVACKIMELIPVVVIFLFMRCFYYFKSLMLTPPTASSSDDTNEDLSRYVLLLEGGVQNTKYTVKLILGSMNRLIHYAERDKRNNLLKILKKSVAFHGVETFDTDQIHSLLDVELVNSWSLPIISLACIAISIPNIHMGEVSNLLESVVVGIVSTHIVEESLNKASEYVNIRRATVMLWKEIAHKHKWLNHSLKRSAYEGKSATEIIKLFAHRAEDILNEFNTSTNRKRVEKENLPLKVIAANSMYRIAKTIMHTYESNNLEITEDELFSRLSVMIADILAACFTNIPRVIIMKCRESAIEKRENSVRDAIRFFGRTTEIIKILETRELPNMDSEKMGFIDEWRLHFKQP